MRLALPRKLSELEIDGMLATLRRGDELHLDRRFSDAVSKLKMVIEEDGVRLEDRMGLDDDKTLQLVTQLSSDPLPDDFLLQLQRQDHLSIRAVGGDYVIPSVKFIRNLNDETGELVLTERRYLDESGIRTMLEESVVDLARPLKENEIDECVHDMKRGLVLSVLVDGTKVTYDLSFREGLFVVKPEDDSEPAQRLEEGELRRWLAGLRFLSVSTWISRY